MIDATLSLGYFTHHGNEKKKHRQYFAKPRSRRHAAVLHKDHQSSSFGPRVKSLTHVRQIKFLIYEKIENYWNQYFWTDYSYHS